MHCVCHRLALILTDAIKGSKACDVVIPDQCVALLNGLYSYFAKSPKRKAFIRTFLLHRNRNPEAFGVVRSNPQEELDRVMAVLEEQHKLPRKVVLTRWLSSAEAVRVVLTCHDTYALFFDARVAQKRVRNCGIRMYEGCHAISPLTIQ